MRAAVIAIVLVAVATTAAAQDHCASCAAPSAQAQPKPSLWEAMTRRTEIRQNTNVKEDIAQAAFVTFTNPDEGPTTYQIGVGVLSSLWSGAGKDLDLLVDYQRNTVTDDEQDAFKAGLTGYWRTQNVVSKGHSPLISARTNFANDGVESTRGWQTAAGYTHVFSGKQAFPVPNAYFSMGGGSSSRTAVLDLIYFPYVGLELDNVLRAPTKEAKGYVTRGVFQINAAFYPAPLKTRRPVEILVGYAYREDLKDTTNETDDSHPLFTFEINCFPIQVEKKGEIGFGVSYKNGEDPDEGFARQSFWLFTLKFRLKKGA
jgi:hypothetical protein